MKVIIINNKINFKLILFKYIYIPDQFRESMKKNRQKPADTKVTSPPVHGYVGMHLPLKS